VVSSFLHSSKLRPTAQPFTPSYTSSKRSASRSQSPQRRSREESDAPEHRIQTPQPVQDIQSSPANGDETADESLKELTSDGPILKTQDDNDSGTPVVSPSPLRPHPRPRPQTSGPLCPPLVPLPRNSPPPRSYRTLSGMLRISSASMKLDSQGKILCPHGKPLKSVDVFTGRKMQREWWFPSGDAIGHSDTCPRCAIGLARDQVSDKFHGCISSPATPTPTHKSQASAITPPPRRRADAVPEAAPADMFQPLLRPQHDRNVAMVKVDVCSHRTAHVPANTDLDIIKRDMGTCWRCKGFGFANGLVAWLPFWCFSRPNEGGDGKGKARAVSCMPEGIRRDID